MPASTIIKPRLGEYQRQTLRLNDNSIARCAAWPGFVLIGPGFSADHSHQGGRIMDAEHS